MGKESQDIFIDIRTEKLSVDEALKFISDDKAGAVNIFTGTTRNHHDGKKVLGLWYDCYPEMAKKELRKIAEKMMDKYNLCRVFLVHKIESVPIGEVSIILAISAAHRKDAFEATAEAMNLIKQDVPIWKKEELEDKTVWKEEI